MEILNNLSIPVYAFQCEEQLLRNVEKEFPNIKFKEDPNTQLSDQYYHKDLFEWFYSCIKEVQKIHYDENFDLVISSAWVNKNYKLTRSLKHRHINSIIAGCLYFSDEMTSPMIIHYPDPYLHAHTQGCIYLGSKEQVLKKPIYPKRGMLILFPGHLYHETQLHKENHIRYSIAFNTFISGTFLKDTTGLLNIVTKSNHF